MLQNSVVSDSDFEEIASITSSCEPFDKAMSASPVNQVLSTLSLFADSGNGNSESSSAVDYPHHETFYFEDGSVTFVVRLLATSPSFLAILVDVYSMS